MLDRDSELKAMFERKDLLLRCHCWNPQADACSCGNPNCAAPGKHPAEKRGVHDARAYKCAKDVGNYNVGIATGHGLVVLDIDPRNGGTQKLAELEAMFGALPKTWRVSTGGGGLHFYFAAPVGTRSNKQFSKSGVELQGWGAYVLAPTSYHKSGRMYEWEVDPADAELAPVPEWLLTMGGRNTPFESSEASGELLAYTFEELMDALNHLSPDSDRATWRNIGWALKDAGVEFEEYDRWSAKSAKYKSSKDCEAVWRSFNPAGGIHAGTLFALAKDAGWEPKAPPEEIDFSQVLKAKPKPKPKEKPKASSDVPEHLMCAEDFYEDPVPTKAPEKEEPKQAAISEEEYKEFDAVADCPDWPPGMLGDLAKAIYASAAVKHKQFAIISALYVVSVMSIGNYTTPSREGYVSTYVNLTASAAVGKEHYRSVANKLIQEFCPAKKMGKPTSSQAMRFRWKACNARSMVADEILSWIESLYSGGVGNGEAIANDILSAWSLAPGEVIDGYETKDAKNATPSVESPILSLLGCGTAQQFEELCSNSKFTKSGLFSRIDAVFATYATSTYQSPLKTSKFVLPIFVRKKLERICKNDPKPKIHFDIPAGTSADKNASVAEVTSEIHHQYKNPKPTRFADGTSEKYEAIHKLCWEQQRAFDGEPIEQGLWSRCGEKVARTGTLLAIIENPDNPVVTDEFIEWAWKWQRYVNDGMRACVGRYKGSNHENLRHHIKECAISISRKRVAKPGEPAGATLWELQRASSLIKAASHRDILDAIASLKASGDIVDSKTRQGTLRVCPIKI